MRTRIQKISKYAPSIFQGKIDFSAGRHVRGRGFSLTIEHPAEPAAFRSLVAVLGVLAVLYVYFVGSTVLNVVARKEANMQATSLASAVAQLESDYFAATQEIGPEDGARLGLAPVAQTEYVHRPGNAVVLTTPGNEI